jgi:hypothetical protein
MYLKSTYTNDFQLGMERINQLMLENAGAVSKMAFEIATGIDANTMLPFREGDSDKKASFLFTDTLPNRVSSALSYLPFISAFDRNNFQHLFGWKMMETPIFGAGSEVDPWTGEVLEPGRGGITGNERFPVRNADRLKDAPQIVGVAREIGFDFKAIAYEQNEVRSIRNLDRAVDKLSTEFADIQKQLNDATVKGTYISPSNVENLRNRASRITDNYLTLRLMQAQLDAYAYDQNKFPPRLQGRLENAAYQRYLGNGESVLQFELEQLIEETSQVYEQIDDLDLANR